MDDKAFRCHIAAPVWCLLAFLGPAVAVGAASAQATWNSAVQSIDPPATFAGDLPCADCEALRYHLDLFADGLYFLRTIYVGKSPKGFDEIGRWTVTADGRTLELRDGQEPPARFEVRDPATLRKLDQAGRRIESTLNYDLARQATFEPIEPALRMRGMFSYFADSGFFAECITGKRLPVAKEGDNAALEAAYLDVRATPGAPLLATLDGRIAQRMPMEGPGPRLTLIVDRFDSVSADQDCYAPLSTASLVNTYWKLMRLGVAGVTVGEGRREPHFILQIAEQRVAGSGGCNRFFGSYALDGDRLTFGPLGGTTMACPDGMEQEHAFHEALGKTATWRITGQHPELFDAAGKSLARFESRYMK
jgi:copper homeostasis protein (lipoprotein)